ncbi:MAG TPA: CorA family divalent cation transporter [Bacteroidales bacterium]|nr:CorA family divalent cation transporter [Bacteroidales bacterium]HPS27526.1 CorA family divalent cation transporter [Bacteroidales bacterium]
MSKKLKTYNSFEWIDLENPTQHELKELTQPFDIDYNLLEDILEHGHLPKIEKLKDYTFLILRAHSQTTQNNIATVGELTNKIAFFINENRLITIHRASFKFLENLAGDFEDSEKLMLGIIDRMLFTYEIPLQQQNDKMDQLEREVFLKNGSPISIETLYYQKSQARIIKKILQVTQNVLNQVVVQHESKSLLQDVKETTLSYLVDYDEVLEDANNILNTYLSVTAKRSNDVMKLLTIFSAFFLPLTFIAGIYGMNFVHMPEITWQNGYYIVLGAMLLVALIIFLWFKKRKIM